MHNPQKFIIANACPGRLVSVMCLLMLPFADCCFAHEQLEEQIAVYTANITADGSNADYYLKRGELYYQHEEPVLAEADYKMVLDLDPDMHLVYLKKAELEYSLDKYEVALGFAEEFLKRIKDDADGLLIKGRCLVELERKVEAAKVYDFLAGVEPDGEPQFYIEYARALEKSPEHGPDMAVKSLKNRMAEHVSLSVYETEVTDILVRKKDYPAAISWLDLLIKKQRRPEFLMFRKVELLEESGKQKKADEIVSDISQIIAAYPEHVRQSPTMAQFINLINQKLKD